MDWTAYPPPDRYGLPGINYPSPNPLDLILIEQLPLRNLQVTTLPMETPHHKDPTCRLTWQGPAHGNGSDINVKRIFANDRNAQEPYNLDQGLSDLADNDYPIFVRSYLLPRDFTPMDMKTPLTAFISLKVTNAGTTALADDRYALTIPPPVSGTQATGFFTVINGVVVGAYFSNTGSGYDADSLPTITAASTTGVTFAVTMQPTLCILTDENVQKAEEMMEGRFVRVQRRWERVPGPLLPGIDTDEETGIITDYTKQVVLTGSISSGVLGSVVTGFSILAGGIYASAPTLTLDPPPAGGVQALATAHVTAPTPAGKLASIQSDISGTNYSSPPAVAIGGVGTGATAASLLNPSQIDHYNVDAPGNDLTDIPIIVVTDPTGTGPATALPTLLATGVDEPVFSNAGTNYDGTSTIVFSAPDDSGGTQATGTLVITAGNIFSVTMTNNGAGYRKRPTAVIDPGSSSGAGAVISYIPLIATGLESVAPISTGLYQSPTASVVMPDGTVSNASVSIALKPTGVAAMILLTAGQDYVQGSTTVTLSGGGGVGATGSAIVATPTLTSVTIDDPGSGYIVAPGVAISGSGGGVIFSIIGSLTYVKVTPVNTIKSIAIRSSLRLSSLPPPKSFPCGYRARKADFSAASVLTLSNGAAIDAGLNETNQNGGSAVLPATQWEVYLIESAYMAYIPPFAFSRNGKTNTHTLIAEAVGGSGSGAFAKLWTFRVTPFTSGDTAGIVDMPPGTKLNFGVRLVKFIVIPAAGF